MTKKDFPALTGVRFVAASLVFVFHYAHDIVADHQSFSYHFLRQLNTGVNLFFVLSGFLITYRYYDFAFSPGSTATYVTRRMARIFPLYLLVLAANYLLLFLSSRRIVPDLKDVLMNVTLLKGLHAGYFFSGLPQSWSLTVEETFYLFAPLSFYLSRRKRFFLLQLPLLVGVGFLLLYTCANASFPVFFGNAYFMWMGTFFGRCFEFFVGMYLALLLLNNRLSPGAGVRYTVSGAGLYLIALAILALMSQETGKPAGEHVAGFLLFNFFLPVAIGVFYYGLLREKSGVRTLLGTKPLVLLGKSSYAFYLLHVGMIAEVIYFHGVANLVVFFVLLQALSLAAYKAFEKPVYFFILRKFTPQRKNGFTDG